MYADGVFGALRDGFTYVAYPAVIFAVFAVVGWRMKMLFSDYSADQMMQWRLAVAGLLPVTTLTFVVVGELPQTAMWFPGADQWKLQLVAGSLTALFTLESSIHVSGNKLAASFMLYLSALGTGLLYVVMEGALAQFQPAVFAVVVMGGLHFVFRERKAWDATEADSWQDERLTKADVMPNRMVS